MSFFSSFFFSTLLLLFFDCLVSFGFNPSRLRRNSYYVNNYIYLNKRINLSFCSHLSRNVLFEIPQIQEQTPELLMVDLHAFKCTVIG